MTGGGIVVKASREVITEIERLLREYEVAVDNARRQGLLSVKSARTYAYHSASFVRWIRGDFEFGECVRYNKSDPVMPQTLVLK